MEVFSWELRVLESGIEDRLRKDFCKAMEVQPEVVDGKVFQCGDDKVVSEGGILGQEMAHLPRLNPSTKPRLRGRDQAVQTCGLQLGLLHP